MGETDASIRRFYAGWDTYNERILEVVSHLSIEELQIRPTPDRWPIWATVGDGRRTCSLTRSARQGQASGASIPGNRS